MKSPPNATPTDLVSDAKAAGRFFTHSTVLKVVGGVFGAALLVAAWYFTVNQSLASLEVRVDSIDEPTEAERRVLIREEIGTHRDQADPHPPLTEALREMRTTQQDIRGELKAQGSTLEAIQESLKEMRSDLRRIRRTHD